MKTNKIIKKASSFFVFSLLIFITIGCFSQQKIILKDGTSLTVVIISRTNDSVKFSMISRPDTVYVETRKNIRTIQAIKLPAGYDLADFKLSTSDSLTNILLHDKKYLHYKHGRNVGIVLSLLGTPFTIAGIGVITSASHDTYELDVLGGILIACIGGALVIPGIILGATSSSKMKKYENKLRGFTFDIKYTPQIKGISVAYRF
jgi:hypothetical protein